MNESLKAMVALMLLMVFAVSCTKPDEPNNDGNNSEQNDSIVEPNNGGGDHNGNNSGTINGHDYVDLGLPNGTMWAICNVGADTPEGYGNYYAWGETLPKELYDWKSYKYGRFFHDRYELNKYCTDAVFGLNGFVDSLTVLDPIDDAALANWGAGWRTPTIEEWDELFQNTTCTWTVQNGVNGWRFTALNGNSIFLPAAGYWWDGEFNCADLGIYWSISLNIEFPYRAWGLHFNSYQCHLCGSSDRNRGQSVRAVCSLK